MVLVLIGVYWDKGETIRKTRKNTSYEIYRTYLQ